jgi:cation transport regulator ChaC
MEAIPADWKDEEGDLHTLYVFGYGSVVWKPGIEYAGGSSVCMDIK